MWCLRIQRHLLLSLTLRAEVADGLQLAWGFIFWGLFWCLLLSEEGDMRRLGFLWTSLGSYLYFGEIWEGLL